MQDILINLVVSLPCQLVLVYAATRLLDIRHKGLFWLVSLAIILPVMMVQESMGQPWRMMLGTVATIAPWLIFSRDPWPRRLFISTLMMLVVVIAEIPPTFLWSHVVGIEIDIRPQAGDSMTYFIAAHLLHLVVLIGLLVVLEALERWLKSTSTRSGIAQFIGFIFVQYLLIGFGVGIMEITGDLSRPIVLGNLIIAVVCVVADAFFFPLMERYNLKVREDQRAQMLAHELASYLASYEEAEREVSAVARVRHDLRNQANVVLTLIGQGAVEKARTYVDQLIGRVAEAGYPALGAQDAPKAPEAPFSPYDDSWRREPARPTARFLRTPRRRVLISLVFPLSQMVVLVFLMWYIVAYHPPLWVHVAVLVAAVLCVAADWPLFRALATIDEAELVAERVRLLEEQGGLQQAYYERLRSGLDEARDMRSRVMETLCEIERCLAQGRPDDAAAIIRHVVDTMDAVGEYCCENRAVGALMAIKLRACHEESIAVDCQIVVPEGLEILDVDLCAVFSNLMDNAIRSCRRVEGPARRVILKACLVSGVLVVDMLNGCVPAGEGLGDDGARPAPEGADAGAGDAPAGARADDHADALFAGHELPVPAHGWGLQILRSLAERYGGSLKTGGEDGRWFRTTVMLINERPAKNAPGGALSEGDPDELDD